MGHWWGRPPGSVWWDRSSVASASAYGLDVGRACLGVDQYQNLAEHCVLWADYAHRVDISVDGKEYGAAGIFRVEHHVSRDSDTKTKKPYEVSVLIR